MLEDEILETIPSLVTEEDNKMLTSPPNMEEVQKVILSMSARTNPKKGLPYPLKPDGFPDSFYIYIIVGISKTSSWSPYFFAEGAIPRSINATFLALIPNIFI